MNWTLTGAASEWGIDRKTLERRMKARGWDLQPRARYHTRDITAAIYGSLEVERIRKTREEADRIELENQRMRGELITADEAKGIFARPLEPIARALKDLPSRLASKVNPGDPALAREELEEFSREVCKMAEEAFQG